AIHKSHAGRKLGRKMQRGQTSHGRKYGESRTGREFARETNDSSQVLARERLDIGAISDLGIGHDSRRIRVGEHHFVALGLERLAGLGARVVELRRLPDDDRPGAEDQDLRDVVATGHVRSVVSRWLLVLGHWFFYLWTIDGFALKGR